ncbi:MAG: SGNH hydrolase domain-containing protein [Tetrasphaera sp.]
MIALVPVLLALGCSGPEPGPPDPGFSAASSTSADRATASPGNPDADLPESVTRTGPYHPVGPATFTDDPDYYDDGCRFLAVATTPPAPGTCHYGVSGGTLVAIVGDSKIGQWMPALQRIAAVENWELLFYSRSSCAFATEGVTDSCASFAGKVFARLRDQDRPRLVFVSHIARSDPVVASETDQLTQLHKSAGTRAVVVEDTIQPGRESVPACLAAASDYWLDCAVRKNDGSGTPGLRQVAAAVPDARLISMNDIICPTATQCPAVLNRIALYRAGSHLTRTFVDAVAPILHQRLIDAEVASGPVLR